MIGAPDGWYAQHGDGCALLVPSDGSSRSAIRYDDGLAPVRDVRALVREHLTEREEPAANLELGVVESLETDEGEFAALIVVRATMKERPVHFAIGFVLFDTHYSRISGVTTDERQIDSLTGAVRRLLRADRYLLGERPRRYRHGPLHGWRESARPGGQRVWTTPTQDAELTTWPAMPLARTTADSLVAALSALDHEAGIITTSGPVISSMNTAGLSGVDLQSSRADRDGRESFRRLLILSCARYAYAARLESTSSLALHREAFDRFARSIEPIPATTVPSEVSDALLHWAN